jgi:hypothetical protein
VQNLAKTHHQAIQKKQAEQANKKRRPVDFYISNYIYLSKKGFAITAPTIRFESQFVGLYLIKKEVGFSYELNIPATFYSNIK